MNWSDLVDAVATLSLDQEERLLDEAHRRRAAAVVPGPGTEHPPSSTGHQSNEPATPPVSADQQQPPGSVSDSASAPAGSPAIAEPTAGVEPSAPSTATADTASTTSPTSGVAPAISQPSGPSITDVPATSATAESTSTSAPVVAEVVRPAEPSSLDWGYSAGSYGTALSTPSGLPRDDGVPTMDQIREKIEGRAARAEGQAILDAESEAGRQRDEDDHAREKAAEDILAKIRASINDKH